MECRRCKGVDCIKSGIVKGKQRYKCKECNYFFREGDGRKDRAYPADVVRSALNLYLEGVGFRAIERILKSQNINVSHVSVINWVRRSAQQIRNIKKQQPSELNTDVMELDEMWHFVKKKE